MYQNPILNAPLGPDGLPVPVDPKRVQEFFEVRVDPGGVGRGSLLPLPCLHPRRRLALACTRGASPSSPSPPNPVLPPLPPIALPAQDFYEDIFLELAKFGEVEYLNVCDNLADHMVRWVGGCWAAGLGCDAA